MANLALFHPTVAVEKSNLPAEQKTAIRAWHERVMERPGFKTALETVDSGQKLIRADGEAAAVGILLGFIEHKLGSLDLGGVVPIDGIIAAGGALGAMGLPHIPILAELAQDSRNVSAAATAIFFHRKAKSHFDGKHGAKPAPATTSSTAHGEQDPLLAWAAKL